MGPSRTVSEINGDFRRKSQIFLTPMRSASTQGFPLELGNVGWLQEIRMTGLSGQEKGLTISVAIWMQYTSVTDGRTDAESPADG